jgi:hypothetical protein
VQERRQGAVGRNGGEGAVVMSGGDGERRLWAVERAVAMIKESESGRSRNR